MAQTERLEAIRVRAEAATSWPTRVTFSKSRYEYHLELRDPDCSDEEEAWGWFATFGAGLGDADAEFYAHAHEDIAWLLGELKRQYGAE